MAQERSGLAQEHRAVTGQADALLGALEQGEAELLLELGDLSAERGLRDVELFGGAADVFGLGHGDEIAKLPQVKHVRPQGTQVCPRKSWTV